MSASIFIDTNVLVYMFDNASPAKQTIALDLIQTSSFTISAQVLGELCVTLTNKLRRPVPADIASQAINDLLLTAPVEPITGSLVATALDASIRYQLSYWDALIIEAAAAAGCHTVMTEDLNAGQTIHDVTIVNPFTQANPSANS